METKRQLVKEVYIKPCAKVFELAENIFIMAVIPKVLTVGHEGLRIQLIEAEKHD